MAGQDYKFEGWMGLDKDAAKGKMVWQEFEPKAWEETDIDIKITHCGICGSDLHTLRSGWFPTMYPCCVGHELVGVAVKVGSKAKPGIKIGDRVGVGAQTDSCLNRDSTKPCPECAAGNESYCQVRQVTTYNSVHFNGGKSYGGYATYNRAPSHFVIKIPDGLESKYAAPMLCGGVTMYSPLVRNGCGPGKTVGIVGLGGLGSMGVQWAKALGADKVVAISRKKSKAADALKLGADAYIATGEEEDWAAKNASTLDLIVCTVHSSSMPLAEYLGMLKTNGTFVQVGAPEEGFPSFSPFILILKGAQLKGSAIGSPKEIEEMLELAAREKVVPWIEERPMKDANKTVVDMDEGKARYRYVLVN